MLRHQVGLGAGELVRPARAPSRSWSTAGAGRTGSRHSEAEHLAARADVALFDQTSFSKIAVRGPDAEAALQYLCSNDVAVPDGRTVYTALLNDRGGYEADVTVTRIRLERVPAGDQQRARRVHDLDVLRRGAPAGLRAEFFDVTSAYAVLSVMGPRSRELLGGLSGDDFSAAAFPFGHSREVDLAGLTVRATRLTYVGRAGLGAVRAQRDGGGRVRAAHRPGRRRSRRGWPGYYAIESLRLEKGYRAFGPGTQPGHHAGRGRA